MNYLVSFYVKRDCTERVSLDLAKTLHITLEVWFYFNVELIVCYSKIFAALCDCNNIHFYFA